MSSTITFKYCIFLFELILEQKDETNTCKKIKIFIWYEILEYEEWKKIRIKKMQISRIKIQQGIGQVIT